MSDASTAKYIVARDSFVFHSSSSHPDANRLQYIDSKDWPQSTLPLKRLSLERYGAIACGSETEFERIATVGLSLAQDAAFNAQLLARGGHTVAIFAVSDLSSFSSKISSSDAYLRTFIIHYHRENLKKKSTLTGCLVVTVDRTRVVSVCYKTGDDSLKQQTETLYDNLLVPLKLGGKFATIDRDVENVFSWKDEDDVRLESFVGYLKHIRTVVQWWRKRPVKLELTQDDKSTLRSLTFLHAIRIATFQSNMAGDRIDDEKAIAPFALERVSKFMQTHGQSLLRSRRAQMIADTLSIVNHARDTASDQGLRSGARLETVSHESSSQILSFVDDDRTSEYAAAHDELGRIFSAQFFSEARLKNKKKPSKPRRSKSRSRSRSRKTRSRSRSRSRSKSKGSKSRTASRSRSRSASKGPKSRKASRSRSRSRSQSRGSKSRKASRSRSRSTSKTRQSSRSRSRSRSRSVSKGPKTRKPSRSRSRSKSKTPTSRKASRSRSRSRSKSKDPAVKRGRSKSRSASKGPKSKKQPSKSRSRSRSKDPKTKKPSRSRSRSKSSDPATSKKTRSKSRTRSKTPTGKKTPSDRSRSRSKSRSSSRSRSKSSDPTGKGSNNKQGKKTPNKSRSKSRSRTSKSSEESRGRSKTRPSRSRSNSVSGSESGTTKKSKSKSRSKSRSKKESDAGKKSRSRSRTKPAPSSTDSSSSSGTPDGLSSPPSKREKSSSQGETKKKKERSRSRSSSKDRREKKSSSKSRESSRDRKSSSKQRPKSSRDGDDADDDDGSEASSSKRKSRSRSRSRSRSKSRTRHATSNDDDDGDDGGGTSSGFVDKSKHLSISFGGKHTSGIGSEPMLPPPRPSQPDWDADWDMSTPYRPRVQRDDRLDTDTVRLLPHTVDTIPQQPQTTSVTNTTIIAAPQTPQLAPPAVSVTEAPTQLPPPQLDQSMQSTITTPETASIRARPISSTQSLEQFLDSWLTF